MPVLDYVTIEGFRSISECIKLELTPVNIVIGANGAGKSNFIEVFSFLHAIREGRLQEYVGKAGGADRILFFGSKQTSKINIRVSFDGEINQYAITLEPSDADELIPTHEVCTFWDKERYEHPYIESVTSNGKEAGISLGKNSPRVSQYVKSHLSKWRRYHVHDTSRSSPMRKTSDLHDNKFLRPDGSNLAAFLYLLQEKHPAEFRMIKKTIQRVAPFFEDFSLSPSSLNDDKIRLEWIHRGADSFFDASSLSDGSLRFIALTTLFLQPRQYRPSVILVDEPELGLHPYAITLFASLVEQASENTQVIISTQSPLLLDHFNPEQVLVADRVDEATRFTRLSANSLEDWLEDYSIGQLWEKNEIGGRPSGGT